MSKTTTARPALQSISRERVRSRRKLYRGLTPNQNSTLRIVTRKIMESGGCCDMSVDNLAAHCGISSSQYRRDMDVIVDRGFIIRIRRPKYRDRSETNLLMLPVVSKGGVGVINERGIQKNLNTNTTTPGGVDYGKTIADETGRQERAGVAVGVEQDSSTAVSGEFQPSSNSSGSGVYESVYGEETSSHVGDRRHERTVLLTDGRRNGIKSYARLRWEHNRFLNHPPAMRELYDRNGALMAENRRLRDSKREDHMPWNPVCIATEPTEADRAWVADYLRRTSHA